MMKIKESYECFHKSFHKRSKDRLINPAWLEELRTKKSKFYENTVVMVGCNNCFASLRITFGDKNVVHLYFTEGMLPRFNKNNSTRITTFSTFNIDEIIDYCTAWWNF